MAPRLLLSTRACPPVAGGHAPPRRYIARSPVAGGKTVKPHIALLPLLLVCLHAGPASARTPTVGYSNEGLKLLMPANIRVAEQFIHVTVDRIRIHYTFENPTTQPIEARVAFPFPHMDLLPGVPVSEVSDFRLSVAGKRQGTRTETVYWLQGQEYRDRTQVDQRLAEEKRRRGKSAADVGASLQRSEVWDQVFPPGERLSVDITYRPSLSSEKGWSQDTYRHPRMRQRFCVDSDTTSTLDRSLRPSPYIPVGFFQGPEVHWLSFTLVTGNNWVGPIGLFHLTVEKPNPQAILSYCMRGMRKTSPTRFEMTQKNYRPDRDLDVIFFRR